MMCQVCNKETDKGYKIDPKTGRVKAGFFYCDLCYEKIYASQNGISENYRTDENGRPRRIKASY